MFLVALVLKLVELGDRTPIYYAIRKSHVETIELLLSYSAENPNLDDFDSSDDDYLGEDAYFGEDDDGEEDDERRVRPRLE